MQNMFSEVAIVGTGPVGLYLLFQLGLLGIKADVFEVLAEPGGQVLKLYPDKFIYDIPALPVCSGHQLIDQLCRQQAVFQHNFYWQTMVSDLSLVDSNWCFQTSHGKVVQAKLLVLATGVGAFLPKSLPQLKLLNLQPPYLFHQRTPLEHLAGKRLFFFGDSDDMVLEIERILHLPKAKQPRQITVIHRKNQMDLTEGSLQLWQTWLSLQKIQFIAGQVHTIKHTAGQLEGLNIMDLTGKLSYHPVDLMAIYFGFVPNMRWLERTPIELKDKQIKVDAQFQCLTKPAIPLGKLWAVGDAITYLSKHKLIISGFA
ncbi:MAG: FAD-dependent oxidoreductase, partial [Gammaproteobacteria bacterium]|nr:FAD-dependent oxidoreductase [Gammaproteobacteria bacterium]